MTDTTVTENVAPSWVTAALALTDSELIALRDEIRTRCTGMASDVESLALLMGARLLAGDASRNVARVASVAIRSARADVARALSTEVPTDTETAPELWTQDRARMWARITSPAADARYRVTFSDVARAVSDSLADTEHGQVWRDASRAYMGHLRDACPACAESGRAPSLLGVLAHLRGVDKGRAEYWALRRQTAAALALAGPRALALIGEWSGTPGARNVWGPEALERADALAVARRVRPATEGPVTALPDLSEVTITRPGHDPITRALSDAEVVALTAREGRGLRHVGEEYGTSTAPQMADPRTGQVKSGKVPARPRKGHRGSTGPMTTGRATT